MFEFLGNRRTALAYVVGMTLTSGLPSIARAQESWPNRSLKCIVPFAAGGATDGLTRLIAKEMGAHLKEAVVVENRGGAAGIPATDAIAKSPPDAHVFGATSLTQMVSNQILNPSLPYNVDQEIDFLTLTATVPLVLCVHASLPAHTAGELRTLLGEQPRRHAYGSYGTGNYGHLAAMHISQTAKAEMVHAPYKGEAPMVADLIAGQVQMAFASLPTARAHAAAGKIRIIGVTGKNRIAAASQIPTLQEQGWNEPIYQMNPGWIGFIAPKKIPSPQRQLLVDALLAATRSKPVTDLILDMGFAPVQSSPEAFKAAYEAELPVWRNLIKSFGIV